MLQYAQDLDHVLESCGCSSQRNVFTVFVHVAHVLMAAGLVCSGMRY